MEDNQNIEEQNLLPKMDRELLAELAEMEQSMEDDFKREYQQKDVASILDSIEYIRIYCRNFPLFNGDNYQPLQAPFAYYRSRSTYLEELPFTEDEFYNFTLIQEAINKLELQPQPTFEFITFLYHIIKVWSENQITTGINRVNNILSILEEQPNAKLKMNIKVDGKNFEFENSLFIHSMLEFYSSHEQVSHYLVERENKRVRERTIQYSFGQDIAGLSSHQSKEARGCKICTSRKRLSPMHLISLQIAHRRPCICLH